MDDRTRQREQDDVDAGMTPQEILARTADATRADRNQALTELAVVLTDEQALNDYGVDLAELRRGIDLSGGWSLP
ncbi:MAG: hypothetical protein ACRYG2_30900 [Janthinobacterium lividum]